MSYHFKGIHIAGNSWLSGTYMMQAGDAEWAGGVDGAPVYGKKSGKSLLYLFKRGSTWRVGRKPGAQNVIVSIAHKNAHVEFGSIYTSSSFFF